MTDIEDFEIHVDQEVSVTLRFDIRASGGPEIGWIIDRAELVSSAVWVDDDQAEMESFCFTDRTRWLVKHIEYYPCERDRLHGVLDETYRAEREYASEIDSYSYREAVRLGVD